MVNNLVLYSTNFLANPAKRRLLIVGILVTLLVMSILVPQLALAGGGGGSSHCAC